MRYTKEDTLKTKAFEKSERKRRGRFLTGKERETVKNKNILLIDQKKKVSLAKQEKLDEEERQRVNEAIKAARKKNKDWQILLEQREGFHVPKQIDFRTCTDEEYLNEIEKTWYKSRIHQDTVKFKPKAKPKEFSGEKSKYKPQVEQNAQLKPTALEVINYKTGTQGYPENVKAFEKEVEKQHPTIRIISFRDLKSREEINRERAAARLNLADMRSDKWVLQKLNALRLPSPTQIKRGKPEKKLLGLKGGDFSESTIKWFKDHPADLIFLSECAKNKTEARRWAGFKGGIKSKGGGRPKKYHTPTERREAKAEGQKRRAREARKRK